MQETRLGLLFPGQGSQSVGMLADLAADYALIAETFAEASEVLGYDLWQLCQQGPQARLNETVHTQPAMLAAGVAVWRVWQSAGGATPTVVAGHSLGEYTALVCAGSLAFGDAVTIVAERARLMQAAVPAGSGAMAAILGLDDDAVRQLCADQAADDVLEAVNFNAPGQVVIAGQRTAVERALAAAKAAGAKRAVLLPVSVPSHCRLMSTAAQALGQALAEVPLQKPTIPVIHNVDAGRHNEAEDIRRALVNQLHAPVLWVDTVRKMVADGTTVFVEAGPGKVLAGLGKRIERTVTVLPVFDSSSLMKALAEGNL